MLESLEYSSGKTSEGFLLSSNNVLEREFLERIGVNKSNQGKLNDFALGPL